MGSSTCNMTSKNKRLFCLFRWCGILIKPRDDLKWPCAIFISRLFWFLWQVLGTGLSILTSTNKETYETENTTSMPPSMSTEMHREYIFLHEKFYVNIPTILILLLFLGPIQGNVIKINMDKFPDILKNIQKLDEMKNQMKMKIHTKMKKKIMKKKSDEGEDEDEDESTQLQNNDLTLVEGGHPELTERSVSVHGKRCTNCYGKDWLPRASIYIFVTLIVISIAVVSFKVHNWVDLLDEYKLIAVMFYLPLPMLTSLFVITLIKEITRLYEVVLNLNDEMFKESKNIEIVSNYLGLLQKTVETMTNDIFEFTLGINFAIFVTSSLMCSYELVEGLKKIELTDDESGYKYRKLVNNFGEIDYIIPLFLSIFFMFWICKVSDSLMSDVHAKIRLRIRCLLPQLYLQHYEERPPEGWSDKPFKKLEFLYKTLRDWPPQVYIYGGWKVNYQLLSAIVLFNTTYSRFSLKE